MNYGIRIRTFRKLKGYTQQEISEKLNMTQSTYSRIETDDHNLSVDELKRISEALDITVGDIISSDPLIINNQSSNHGAQGRIENFYSENKEMYEKLLETMNAQVIQLKGILDILLSNKTS